VRKRARADAVPLVMCRQERERAPIYEACASLSSFVAVQATKIKRTAKKVKSQKYKPSAGLEPAALRLPFASNNSKSRTLCRLSYEGMFDKISSSFSVFIHVRHFDQGRCAAITWCIDGRQ
jgi:hypothetical protein